MLNLQNSEESDPENLVLVRVLNRSRYPVLLMQQPTGSMVCVTKLFPITSGNISRAYLSEANLLNFSHSNIIQIYACYPQLRLECLPQANSVSGVLMEYAPNGDICELLSSAERHLSEAAIRTLFLQLLDALEYLHLQGFAHMDIKPDNLLLSKDFTLKLADFDQLSSLQDTSKRAKGTPGYRAPEVKDQTYQNLVAADIFSAGVVLFVLKSRVPPFAEGKLSKGVDLYQELIKENNEKFWKAHSKVQQDYTLFSESFKELIKKMLALRPEERPSISEIRKSEWCCGPKLDQHDLAEELSRL